MTTTAAGPATAPTVAVCRQNLLECLDSSRYWIEFLPAYANEMQRRADRWSVAAGILAAVTGMSVWATLQQSSTVWAQGLVSLLSLLTAICALVPRVKNFGEMAGHARELSARYGQVSGDLMDVWADQAVWATDKAHEAIEAFDAVKAAKDANLRDLPLKPSGEVRRDPGTGLAIWPHDVYRMAKKGQSLPAGL